LRSKTGAADIDKRLVDAMLARNMKWTWQQLRSQPREFIDILQLMARQDAIKQNEELAKAEAQAKASKAKRR